MCVRILRRHADRLGYTRNFTIYDDKDSKQIIKRILSAMNLDLKKYPINRFSSAIDSAKNNGWLPERYAKEVSGYEGSINAEVYDRYQKELVASDAMDFGDLLVNAHRLFKQHVDVLKLYQDTIQYVLVDEFQDTNEIQYELMRNLAAPQENLFVVGDDDQSIYAFRGATIANILNFEKDFPNAKVVTLDQNYRSTQSILELAHSVIAKNTKRKPKKLWSDSEQGSPIYSYVGEDEGDEASFVARQVVDLKRNGTSYDDIAIFYRTNAQSRALEEAFMDRGIPYKIFGGLKFYDRKEIKDILAYLRVVVSDADNQAFVRTLNNPPRGIGAKALQGIVDIAKAEQVPLWTAACEFAPRNKNVAGYVALIKELRAALVTESLSALIGKIIDSSGYLKRLSDDKDPTALSRKENLKELQAIALTMENIDSDRLSVVQQFLDRVALSSSADIVEDQQEGGDSSTVSLMTVHLAKGLEFPFVFFTGIEEGLVPHSRSMNSPADIEEERRLCYVGITRAMRRLYLTRARKRGMFSAGDGFGLNGRFREPSRFVFDMPQESLESLGGDFMSSSPFDENTSDDFGFEPVGWARPKKAPRTLGQKLALANSLVSSADSLLKSTPARAQAPLTEITPGVEVLHPTFGKGTVNEVLLAQDGELARSKVSITFAEDTTTRKLVLGKARLSLA
jgi:DNA helicase-2/ATP-dependent DNA helicase PcrA